MSESYCSLVSGYIFTKYKMRADIITNLDYPVIKVNVGIYYIYMATFFFSKSILSAYMVHAT